MYKIQITLAHVKYSITQVNHFFANFDVIYFDFSFSVTMNTLIDHDFYLNIINYQS